MLWNFGTRSAIFGLSISSETSQISQTPQSLVLDEPRLEVDYAPSIFRVHERVYSTLLHIAGDHPGGDIFYLSDHRACLRPTSSSYHACQRGMKSDPLPTVHDPCFIFRA